MATAAKSANAETDTDLEKIRADLAALRDDLRSLAGHLKDGTVNGLGGEASRIYDRLLAQGDDSLDTVSRYVNERPVSSLLIAFAAGLVGGRMLSR